MFNINFRQLAFQTIAWFLRKANWLRFVYSAVKPLRDLNNDGTPIESFGQKSPSMFHFQRFIKNFLRFDARTIYLQRYLNQIYDPVNEKIKIVNDNTFQVRYMFNDAEQQAPDYFYNKWQAATSYVASPADFVYLTNKVFKCTANSTGDQPPNISFWEDQGVLIHMFNKVDTFIADYIVEIPLVVTLQPDYSTEKITAEINQLNAAGRVFVLQIV